ncbi:MAG TPA: OsmC family protein [Steroidobacteraceae bacterium]|nr:OsmC family protein [Steroidobacteraceae bacterium]
MDQENLQAALTRVQNAFAQHPSLAKQDKVTTATVREGTLCQVAEDGWQFVVDMPETLGGTVKGPTPGTYVRSGLAACLAIGYSMRAALLGVPIRGVQIELQADMDLRGIFCGMTTVPAYNGITYVVTVDSDAPESDIRRVLDEADARSPYMEVFRRPQSLRRETKIVRSETV